MHLLRFDMKNGQTSSNSRYPDDLYNISVYILINIIILRYVFFHHHHINTALDQKAKKKSSQLEAESIYKYYIYDD